MLVAFVARRSHVPTVVEDLYGGSRVERTCRVLTTLFAVTTTVTVSADVKCHVSMSHDVDVKCHVSMSHVNRRRQWCPVSMPQVNGVSTSSPTYAALAGLMLFMCSAFLLVWIAVVAQRCVINLVRLQQQRQRDAEHASRRQAGAGSVSRVRKTSRMSVRGDSVAALHAGDGGREGANTTTTTAAAVKGGASPTAITIGTPVAGRGSGRRGFTVENPLRGVVQLGTHVTPLVYTGEGGGGGGGGEGEREAPSPPMLGGVEQKT